MSSNHLIIELLHEWFIEENYALTNNNNNLLLTLLAIRGERDTLRRQLADQANEIEELNRIMETHVQLNLQLQERIDYLELFIIRLRDFPTPITARQARRQLSFSDVSSDTESE